MTVFTCNEYIFGSAEAMRTELDLFRGLVQLEDNIRTL